MLRFATARTLCPDNPFFLAQRRKEAILILLKWPAVKWKQPFAFFRAETQRRNFNPSELIFS